MLCGHNLKTTYSFIIFGNKILCVLMFHCNLEAAANDIQHSLELR